MNQLFIDCDGVLADFDTAAEQLFKQNSREAQKALGTPAFWRKIRSQKNFYGNLSLLPDALELYRAVAHLNPIILTGCPHGGWAEQQKMIWAAQHFPGVRMITCLSREKCRFLTRPGDILVDDYLKYRQLWEQAGGIFVHHLTAKQTLESLSKLGVPVRGAVEQV